MRVLHVVRAFSPLSETFLYDTITETARLGAEASVFALKRANAAERPFEPVTVARVPRGARPDRLVLRAIDGLLGDRAPRLDWRFHRAALREHLIALRPDVVHAHFGPMGVLALPVTSALGVPLVTTFHGYDLSKLVLLPAWRRAYARLFAMARITVVSDRMRQRAVELGCPPGAVQTIHVGKRLADYPFRTRPDRPLRFVSVGRLVHKKGFEDAVAATAEARRRGLDATLRIVGDGPLTDTVARAIRERGVQGAVELLGPLPHREVIAELDRSDAFLLCSKVAPDGDEEGIPTVLFEAQALGLPCVATRHAGIPEGIAPEGHHLLAPEGDVAALAERMGALAGMSAEARAALAEAGRRHVLAEFELESQTRRYLALYGDCTKER